MLLISLNRRLHNDAVDWQRQSYYSRFSIKIHVTQEKVGLVYIFEPAYLAKGPIQVEQYEKHVQTMNFRSDYTFSNKENLAF